MSARSSRHAGGPRRRLRGAVAAILLGGTVLSGTAIVLDHPSQAAAPADPSAVRGALPGSFADLVARVSPAVVTISTTQEVAAQATEMPQFPPGSPFEEFFRRFGQPGQPGHRGGGQPVQALGSGFIIDAEGHVVTNNHVVEDAADIAVTMQDGTELPATLVGRDPQTDLALLKVDADRDLPHLAFGDSDSVRVGDWVVAVGNPFGLGGTVTAGIVSARGRDIHAGPYDDFIQTDAAINRGNSGGPTFDENGNVIGINTAIFSPSGGSVGIGFAIPSNLAEPILAELKENGTVSRGWLGVQIQEVTPDIAESLGLDAAAGALVASVQPDSPAARAGFRAGDLIGRYDGKAIETVRDLTRAVAATDAGTEVAVVVRRDGSDTTLTARIDTLDHAQVASAGPAGAESTDDVLGLRLSRLDDGARAELGLAPGTDGVLVVGVEPGPAREALRPGDVIVQVGGRAVTAPQQVATAVGEARTAGRKAVLMLVNRRGGQQFVTVELRRA